MVYASRLPLPLGTLISFAILSAWCALVPSFCPSGHDFAIASSLPSVATWNLRLATGFVGNYAPYGLSPQIQNMPVIQRNVSNNFCQTRYHFWNYCFPFSHLEKVYLKLHLPHPHPSHPMTTWYISGMFPLSYDHTHIICLVENFLDRYMLIMAVFLAVWQEISGSINVSYQRYFHNLY